MCVRVWRFYVSRLYRLKSQSPSPRRRPPAKKVGKTQNVGAQTKCAAHTLLRARSSEVRAEKVAAWCGARAGFAGAQGSFANNVFFFCFCLLTALCRALPFAQPTNRMATPSSADAAVSPAATMPSELCTGIPFAAARGDVLAPASTLLSAVASPLLAFLTTRDAACLRAVCTEARAAVAEHPWADHETLIRSRLEAWRACFPRARGHAALADHRRRF